MTENGSNRVCFGPFQADLRTHELWKEGIRLRLSGQPFQVLELLLERPGELVTRDDLRSRIWQDDTFVDFSHGLNAAVNKLREALCDSAQEPRYIETLPRRGYRFIAKVEQVQKKATVAPASTAIRVPTPPPEAPPPIFQAEASRPLRRSFYLVATAVLALLLVGVYFVTRLVTAEAHDFASVPLRIKPLTSLPDSTGNPVFSSDGNYVAFYRDGAQPGTSGIYVKQIGADRLMQVTHHASDCCPVWSPDNRFIAFSRRSETKEVEIYIAPSGIDPKTNGIAERRLDTGTVKPRSGEMDWAHLDWSPDGNTIAFDGGAGIFLLSLKDSSLRRLTEVTPTSEDWGPSFSADGKRLLFVRSGEAGVPEEIRIASISGGETTLVTSELGKIHGPPQWSSDGHSVIFSAVRNGQPALWRVSADKRDNPVQINDSGWHPSVARKGYLLAYQRLVHGLNIWEMDLSRPDPRDHILISATSQTDQGPGPQFSPDGTKIAYMSDRSGTLEIWVADRDGSNAYQLTAVGSAGTPRWSPDGRSIAFDARGKKAGVIYTVGLDGAPPRQITEDADKMESVCPSWSHDGQWIYFSSSRTGPYQVWKELASGGAAIQVTKQGGHAAFESPDGKYLYYAKTYYANPAIWRVPVNGGDETPVSPMIRPSTWASWAVVDRGILFAGSGDDGRPVISLYDFATHRVKKLADLSIVPFWLGATRDGKDVAFDKPGWQQSQVMLVENFR
jgi:Tol biopolymer transport system component/DNA-binding winged helix-turn-helix (wHTH) protein